MADFFSVTIQNSHAAFRAELRLAGIAGIKIKNSIHRLAKFLVRVAEDDHVRSVALEPRRQFFRRVERVDDVMDEKFFVRQRDHFGFLECESEVGVAEDGGDGRDEFQFEFNHRVADVARVQNVSHAREKLFHTRVEETVGVRDDADFHWRFFQ